MRHDGKFWMFSEGGRKFIGLEKNSHVCLAIYDKYDGFGNLRSLQVTGIAAMVEPFSEEYNTHAAFKKIPLDALKKLPSPMNLICVTPTRIDALFSDFKKDGYSVRQVFATMSSDELKKVATIKEFLFVATILIIFQPVSYCLTCIIREYEL